MIDFRLASAAQIQAELGERLRQQRLSRSWTQRDLAMRAGIAVNAVRNLEAGGNATVLSMVKVLQVLSLVHELGEVFKPGVALSIADLERLEQPQTKRARARKS
ncbi:helix-turn-helix domain-containing protein [Mitsuaria sp. GD03876]|uniref:helix-turn-helix domain-containing protein n=1 Tax=Mitsuaria sp. GD03876 TaxID=2975399 RepID=UPI00244ACD87|nr:helix-turn-helix domain-containing protein [Mitsuaria sp. GD03876]MDH0862998.1 helix-turn-helix domain-containing protein [Mitsuaria sp. GD03876]